MRPAPYTFSRKTDAQAWLTKTEAEIMAGDWLDPDAGRAGFLDYARAWIDERPNLRPKTVQLYNYLLRHHLQPTFGKREIGSLNEPLVRHWRKTLLDQGVSGVTVAKAYRLLKAILNTAVDDGALRRNPCRIKGAGEEKHAERTALTIPQLYSVADAVDQRYRMLVLLAAFGQPSVGRGGRAASV